jgi:hypothetical protein
LALPGLLAGWIDGGDFEWGRQAEQSVDALLGFDPLSRYIDTFIATRAVKA